MYNFDTVVDRKNTYSIKWMDEKNDMIPMWVADMDFKSPDEIISRLIERVGHGIYGYTSVPDAYYDAVANWSERRHNLKIERDWILPSSGVVPSIAITLRALLKKGDSVLIQPPVYNAFYGVLKEQGYDIVENSLILKENTYQLDFHDFERKIIENQVKVYILCNPHNPVGRSWSKEDLIRLGEICLRNNVMILADEIHRDLMLSNGSFVPFLSIAEEVKNITVSLTSPSKTFNLGGVKVSNLVIPNETLREKVSQGLNDFEISSPNLFGIEALIAGYTESEKWVDALLLYIEENMKFAKAFLESKLANCPVISMDATYLMWLDCRVYGLSSEAINEKMMDAGVRLNSGSIYGHAGEGFMRINLATSRQTLDEGLKRIVKTLKGIEE